MDKKELYQLIQASSWDQIRLFAAESEESLHTVLLGRSLLNYAIEQDNLAEAEWLIQQGLSPNYSDGCSPPIALAIQQGDLVLSKWLIDHGTDVNSSPGDKPLIFSAIHSGSLNIVRLLLENGASLDCSWGSWDSPMSNALAGDNEEIVEMIRSHTNATDDQINAARATAKTKTRVTFAENLSEPNLDRLETQLGVKLPPVYRSFLESFPDDLVTNDDQGVFHSTELIFRSTTGSRDYNEDDWAKPFPKHFVCIGWNGGGSIFCVDTNKQEDEVYLFDHELGDVDPNQTQTLEEFASAVREW